MISQYAQVFLDSLLNGLIIPPRSDTMFFALKGFGVSPLWPAAIVATLGGTAAQGVNYGVGRALLMLRNRGHIYVADSLYARLQKIGSYALLPLMLVAWFGPGGAWPFFAGFLRLKLRYILPLAALGEAAYYLFHLHY